ncbi:hypothetical protein [Krasilnikovia sp. MM14-A1259]|uniref:hypothetical protein n=1 Tax=Krasilnikovia sp. MM14-A1259 TaxID=3373539 RepID=UPI0038200731
MTYYWFGGDLAAYVITAGAGNVVTLAPGAVVTFWTAQTGGAQITDLVTADGTPITQVIAADGSGAYGVGALPRFRASVLTMWAQAGSGPRVLILTTDLPDLIEDLQTPATPEIPVILPPLTVAGAVTGPQIGLSRLYNDTGMTLNIAAIRASVGTAPTGDLVVDVRRNGASVFSTPAARPKIASGLYTTGRIAPTELITLAPEDYLSADIASGSSGGNLVIQVLAERAR